MATYHGSNSSIWLMGWLAMCASTRASKFGSKAIEVGRADAPELHSHRMGWKQIPHAPELVHLGPFAEGATNKLGHLGNEGTQ